MDMARFWLRSAACEGCAVRGDAICANLDDGDFADFARLGRHRRLARGQVLAWEDEERTHVGTLLSGVLKITAATADGREQIVGLAWPSDLVGSPFGPAAGFRVTALSDAEICLVDRSAFEAFVQDQPAMERDLLRRSAADLDRARAFMLLLGRMTAEERLATLLLDMADRAVDPMPEDEEGFLLPLGRQEIADILGLTIETVSRQLRKLVDAGLIRLKGRRTVHLEDRPRLEAIAAA